MDQLYLTVLTQRLQLAAMVSVSTKTLKSRGPYSRCTYEVPSPRGHKCLSAHWRYEFRIPFTQYLTAQSPEPLSWDKVALPVQNLEAIMLCLPPIILMPKSCCDVAVEKYVARQLLQLEHHCTLALLSRALLSHQAADA